MREGEVKIDKALYAGAAAYATERGRVDTNAKSACVTRSRPSIKVQR
jgi:hypothetical protein